LFVILIAPNVSEQMGGEAMKALQLYQELKRQGIALHQIVHERVRAEIEAKFPDMPVTYVIDDWVQKWAWRSRVFRPLVAVIFHYRAARLAAAIAAGHRNAIVHFNTPVSPVRPYFDIPGVPVVIGPLNGNIHYPPAFRHEEPLGDKARRLGHPIAQRVLGALFSGKRTARALLVAGGERTYQSLRMAGCREEQFVDSIDSGIPNRLAATPRIEHRGRNLRFVQNGRMVKHKGAGLVIQAMARTRHPVELDLIGRGPEREIFIALAKRLGLEQRVHFRDWIEDHAQVAQMLRQYRGFVFPSLAEANGIVVQEAMYQGLPVICLNWGGPALLVTEECGIAIEPRSEEYVIDELARAMDRLAEDGDLAERMSRAGRERATREGYLWADAAAGWVKVYRRVMGMAADAG
jgi:glycosyltransferase involved in cell wall biosynthesis